MSNKLHQALVNALLRLMRPLVSVLLNHGMAYGTFAELARKAYVDEAFRRGAGNGKRATISSVSALTGLTRKETKRLREISMVGDQASVQRYSRAVRVISGWVNDASYHDESGEPRVLSYEGETPSFAGLVREFSGDIPPAAMLSVLQESASVKCTDGQVTLIERAYIPRATPLDKIAILGADVAELIGTIGHNLDAEPGQRRFQRKVSNVAVREEALPAFREYSNKKSQQLLEDYHAWLSNHEVSSRDDGQKESPRYVAVGIYYTEDSDIERVLS
jgi:hypothetical protein